MQAVILAAGKSTRTYPLTLTKPKPLLKVANKTLLEHNLDNLNNIVDEVIIVVGYKKNQIIKYAGNKYENIRIKYVEQKKQSGTGNALLVAEKYIKSEFISLYGDDIYSREDFKNILKYKYSILTSKAKRPELFGVVVEKNNVLSDLIEKPQKFISNLVSTGLYKLDKKIFLIIKRLKKSKRNEYELTDAIKELANNENIHCVASKQWIPIGYAWDLLKADKILRGNANIIGKNSKIYGDVRNSSIGDNCVIKGNVKNSIIMDKTIIDKNTIVEDSVIGENVHFKGKILAKNKIFLLINNRKIQVGRLGAIVGDNSKLVDVDIKAGCIISPNKKIKNKKIEHDV